MLRCCLERYRSGSLDVELFGATVNCFVVNGDEVLLCVVSNGGDRLRKRSSV